MKPTEILPKDPTKWQPVEMDPVILILDANILSMSFWTRNGMLVGSSVDLEDDGLHDHLSVALDVKIRPNGFCCDYVKAAFGMEDSIEYCSDTSDVVRHFFKKREQS